MTRYPDIDADGWEILGSEQMGSKPDKVWLRPPRGGPMPHDRSWLFKPTTRQRERDREYLKGDDWAEKISAEIAVALGLPAAPVELATHGGIQGILSGDISRGLYLVLGNEILYGHDADYDRHRRRGVPGYGVEAIFGALRALQVVAPAGATLGDACRVFGGYLLLDALVANTDRHHENWGILVDPSGDAAPQLAPTFDHASCLGFQLSDDEREERIGTRDAGRSVTAFANRGRSRHFAGSPGLVELALSAVSRSSDDAARVLGAAVEGIDEARLEQLVAGVPGDRMSLPARIFSLRLMTENRRRLLDGLYSAS